MVNVAKLVTMQTNAELIEDVTSADLINVDGKGVLWGARLCGIPVPERVAGVEEVRERFRGTPHIFNLGHGITPQATPENVAELVRLVKGA